MKDGLIEKIKSQGYWRINLRPLSPLEEKLSIANCRQLVSDANVELRGWDYPHVLYRNDDNSGYANGDGFFENWTDWGGMHIEFWRLFQSGQFLHYRAMWEDWEEPDNLPAKPFLSIEGAIYLFTEVVEFANRLAGLAKLSNGVAISITGHGTEGRRLWVGRNRISFFEPKVTQAASIEVVRTLTIDGTTSPIDVSLDLLKEFFDRFGWTPLDDQIRSDQERLMKRQF